MQIRKERYQELIRKEIMLKNIHDVITGDFNQPGRPNDALMKVHIIEWLMEVCDERKN